VSFSLLRPRTVLYLALALVLLGGLWVGARNRQVGGSTPQGLAAVTAAGTSQSNEAAVRYGWGRVVAGDEFNYRGAPAKTKWQLYDSVGHAGRGRRSPSAWSVDGSVATVVGTATGRTGGMSARFGHQRYGRWEARMRTTARDPEYHPVLLLWPDEPVPSRCPEVDYAESSAKLDQVKFYLHYGCKPLQTRAVQRIDGTRWNNFAVQWTPRSVTGYINGVRWFRDTEASHIPRTSMHQTVQLDWFPDGTRTHESAMLVDWVRVYRAG
jgi:hypothetical protein